MKWHKFLIFSRGKAALGFLVGCLSVSVSHSVMSAPAQDPLFLAQPVRPVMMLNMSRDHQLFFKLYDDYSNITDSRLTIKDEANSDVANPNYGKGPDSEGAADTTYVHGYDYYGYFDSEKCYTYSTTSNRFNPRRSVNDEGYCNYTSGVTNEWSGNFLNWASMTRMDAVRKILYGGLRSTDTGTTISGGTTTTGLTVLERAFLPQDAHSFAKYYNGTDIHRLTPFGSSQSVTMGQTNNNSGITICNTTEPTNRNNLSQSDTGAPLIRVARGNYSLWASNERWQCRWNNGSNDNNAALSGINAHTSSPANSGNNNRQLGGRDFIVRVSVCDPARLGSENCKQYGNTYKPIGLLQEYGEDERIHFGLMTGSYEKNKSGGVLRKVIGSMNDEINANGTFKIPANGNSIVGTLDRLRIYGYRFDDGIYHRDSHGIDDNGSDGCLWSRNSFADGHCSNWGNPQSEIYLESLRYLSGQAVNAEFAADDSDYIAGLNSASWNQPITNDNYCAPLSVIQFNASTSSFDGNQLSATDIGLTNIGASTDIVGAAEGIHNNSYFIGSNGVNTDQLCTAKNITSLANVNGTCPDAPRLAGSYQIAGLAYHARSEGIPLNNVDNDVEGPRKQTVTTYGVALAPAVPRVIVPVPGSTTHKITILPACRNINSSLGNTPANCAIVDFKIVDQQFSSTANTGKLYVNWEDSEQGGDFDQDMWGVISYSITNSQVTVTTQVIAQSTGDPMGFGYVISGVQDGGFKVHSGVNSFTYGTSCTTSSNSTYCTCRVGNGFDGTAGACNTTHARAAARSQTYTIDAASDAQLLEPPLYYAAKWGGYKDNGATPTEIAALDPNTYFYATDPRELETSLRQVFDDVEKSVGSAAAAATNSTRLSEGSYLYQASFNSGSWWGELRAIKLNNAGNPAAPTTPTDGSTPLPTTISTNTTLLSGEARSIYTYNGTSAVIFEWANLTTDQKNHLMDGGAEALGQSRLSWLRGNSVEGLRVREKSGEKELLLGDIVNSSPVYLGGTDMRYDRLPGAAGASYREYLYGANGSGGKKSKTPRIFVGANDGMLHAFNANDLTELFAYVPGGVYPKLADLTNPGYGTASAGIPHQYLVDGQIAAGDAYINGEWRSIIVGSLGAGGRGIFALDVTDAVPQVLFELNNLPSLGFVMGQPFIVPLKSETGIRWAAVFGNGYEAGSTSLYWVDLEDRSVNTITASASGQGLSAPALLPNSMGIIEAAYAGDLDGYLWKFDLSSTNADNWSATSIFRAVTPDESPQPQAITAPPTLGVNAKKNNAIMVYFGTGKYLYAADNTANIPVQSFYAIVDKADGVTGRDALHQKVMGTDASGRRITDATREPDWSAVEGWYMDFPATGERVTTKPLLLYDKLIFATLIPSPVPCAFGGSSWIMEVPAVGDKYVDHNILDENIPNSFLILGDLGFGVLNPVDPDNPEPGDGGESGGSEAQCEPGQFPAKVYAVGSGGALTSQDGCLASSSLGRMSWRQLR